MFRVGRLHPAVSIQPPGGPRDPGGHTQGGLWRGGCSRARRAQAVHAHAPPRLWGEVKSPPFQHFNRNASLPGDITNRAEMEDRGVCLASLPLLGHPKGSRLHVSGKRDTLQSKLPPLHLTPSPASKNSDVPSDLSFHVTFRTTRPQQDRGTAPSWPGTCWGSSRLGCRAFRGPALPFVTVALATAGSPSLAALVHFGGRHTAKSRE